MYIHICSKQKVLLLLGKEFVRIAEIKFQDTSSFCPLSLSVCCIKLKIIGSVFCWDQHWVTAVCVVVGFQRLMSGFILIIPEKQMQLLWVSLSTGIFVIPETILNITTPTRLPAQKPVLFLLTNSVS